MSSDDQATWYSETTGTISTQYAMPTVAQNIKYVVLLYSP